LEGVSKVLASFDDKERHRKREGEREAALREPRS